MSAVTDRFVAMSADELKEYFCTADVAEITGMIRAASDADLRRLIELDHFREGAVDAILDRFAEFADADRLAEIDGVVRFELVRSKKEIEGHTARFARGMVALAPGSTPGRDHLRPTSSTSCAS